MGTLFGDVNTQANFIPFTVDLSNFCTEFVIYGIFIGVSLSDGVVILLEAGDL